MYDEEKETIPNYDDHDLLIYMRQARTVILWNLSNYLHNWIVRIQLTNLPINQEKPTIYITLIYYNNNLE